MTNNDNVSNIMNHLILNDDETTMSTESPNNEELCIICYDCLDCSGKQKFTLPECGHSFHQGCINAWFRQGNKKCPLCNDIGTGNSQHNTSYYRSWLDKFIVLRRLSKKKNAPPFLVKTFEKIKKKEEKLKEFKKDYKKWKDAEVSIEGEPITINEIIKEFEKKRRQCRTKEWNLRCYKKRLFEGMNIAPVILVEKKII